MKNILLIAVLLASTTSFAATKQLLCQVDPHNSPGAFGINVDESRFSPGSDLAGITSANWAYMYSSAQLICSTYYIQKTGQQDLKCIGYNQAGGLTEISVSLQDGAGTATVHGFGEGVDKNIYAKEIEGMQLPCRLR